MIYMDKGSKKHEARSKKEGPRNQKSASSAQHSDSDVQGIVLRQNEARRLLKIKGWQKEARRQKQEARRGSKRSALSTQNPALKTQYSEPST